MDYGHNVDNHFIDRKVFIESFEHFERILNVWHQRRYLVRPIRCVAFKTSIVAENNKTLQSQESITRYA